MQWLFTTWRKEGDKKCAPLSLPMENEAICYEMNWEHLCQGWLGNKSSPTHQQSAKRKMVKSDSGNSPFDFDSPQRDVLDPELLLEKLKLEAKPVRYIPEPEDAAWLRSYARGESGELWPRPEQQQDMELVKKKFSLHAQTLYPLHLAAMEGNIAKIRGLIRIGLNPNQQCEPINNSKPLGWAAHFGHLGAVITLIELGADPFPPPNKKGMTPKLTALREKHSHILLFFTDFEIRIRDRTLGGYRPVAVELPQEIRIANDSLKADLEQVYRNDLSYIQSSRQVPSLPLYSLPENVACPLSP